MTEDRRNRLHGFLDAICDTDLEHFTDMVESFLRNTLNGATAVKHLRMYPQFAAEAVHTALRNHSVRRKGRRTQ